MRCPKLPQARILPLNVVEDSIARDVGLTVVTDYDLDVVSATLEPFFEAVAIDPTYVLGLEYTYGSQYDGDLLLERLVDIKAPTEYLFAVTARDLTLEHRPYVFGIGHITKHVAVVSTKRIHTPIHIKRVVTHEYGHTMGLRHCNNIIGEHRCIMYGGVANPESLDNISDDFCEDCHNAMWFARI